MTSIRLAPLAVNVAGHHGWMRAAGMSIQCGNIFFRECCGRVTLLLFSTSIYTTSSHELASQFGLQFFHTRKASKTIANIGYRLAHTTVYFNEAPTARECVRVCVRAYMRACVMCFCLSYRAYYNIILFDPWLIMIIIKNIILYFINISDTLSLMISPQRVPG